MNRQEIEYLMNNGFSIGEIMQMDHPKEDLAPSESVKAGDTAGVAITPETLPDTRLQENTEVVEKKNSDYSDLLQEVKELKKTIQDSNRQAVTIPAPEEYTAEQAIQDFFNEVK